MRNEVKNATLFLQEIADQQVPPHRAMTVLANSQDDLSRFADDVDRARHAAGGILHPVAIAGAATRVMRPIMENTSPDIRNGWKEKRFRFNIKIYTHRPDLETSTETTVSGYTDIAETIGMNKFIPEDTTFFINNISFNDYNDYGKGYRPGNFNMISNQHSHNRVDTIRPSDMFLSERLKQNADIDEYNDYNEETIDGTSLVTGTRFINVDTSVASQYLSTTINAFETAHDVSEGGFQQDAFSIATNAAGMSTNETHVRNPLLDLIADVDQDSMFSTPASFTWENFISIVPHANSLLKDAIIPISKSVMTESESLDLNTHETNTGWVVFDNVAALMARFELSMVDFTLHNNTRASIEGPAGRPEIVRLEYSASGSVQVNQSAVLQYILQFLYPAVSQDGDSELTVSVQALSGGSCNVSVKLGHGADSYAHPFNYPMYASGLVNPNVSGDSDSLANARLGMGDLFDGMKDRMRNKGLFSSNNGSNDQPKIYTGRPVHHDEPTQRNVDNNRQNRSSVYDDGPSAVVEI